MKLAKRPTKKAMIMTNKVRTWATPPLFVVALALSATSCGDDSDDPDEMGDDDDAAGDDDDAGGWVCDEVGAHPEMGALLNAPVDPAQVEIIVKVYQHPGNPGPLELP
ncbi:MAG: hypothetical protein B7733_11545 [Myxococcales bacterium FL481]|nr:MAG: hypothetical protein B7733_11545 [Myxococcales bacterium FL481]